MHDFTIGQPMGAIEINGIVTDSYPTTMITEHPFDFNVLIQHELSHNLGADHETCFEHQCVLSDDGNSFYKWCDACSEAIKANY